MLLGKFFLKRMMKKAQQQYNQKDQQSNQKSKRKEGDTYVHYKPDEKKHIPKNEGDYIDYEEIKWNMGLCWKKSFLYLQTQFSPDGGIGRRAGLKNQWALPLPVRPRLRVQGPLIFNGLFLYLLSVSLP